MIDLWSRKGWSRSLAGLAFLAAVASLSPSHAADGIDVELNKLEPQENACRVYMVFVNATGHAFSSYKPELIFFDGDGVIAERLVIEGGPLPAGKTKVKLFDVAGVACTAIGRVLLNGIAACEGGASVPDCLAMTRATSRTDINFIK